MLLANPRNLPNPPKKLLQFSIANIPLDPIHSLPLVQQIDRGDTLNLQGVGNFRTFINVDFDHPDILELGHAGLEFWGQLLAGFAPVGVEIQDYGVFYR